MWLQHCLVNAEMQLGPLLVLAKCDASVVVLFHVRVSVKLAGSCSGSLVPLSAPSLHSTPRVKTHCCILSPPVVVSFIPFLMFEFDVRHVCMTFYIKNAVKKQINLSRDNFNDSLSTPKCTTCLLEERKRHHVEFLLQLLLLLFDKTLKINFVCSLMICSVPIVAQKR